MPIYIWYQLILLLLSKIFTMASKSVWLCYSENCTHWVLHFSALPVKQHKINWQLANFEYSNWNPISTKYWQLKWLSATEILLTTSPYCDRLIITNQRISKKHISSRTSPTVTMCCVQCKMSPRERLASRNKHKNTRKTDMSRITEAQSTQTQCHALRYPFYLQ